MRRENKKPLGNTGKETEYDRQVRQRGGKEETEENRSVDTDV